MGLLGRLRRKEKPHRVVFIGLDGTPYTFMQRLIEQGRAPNAARLAQQGSLLRMDSMWPWVSSVAWSTMMTGVNPAKHNIFGFIDRDPATNKQFIPTSRNMKAKTLWEVLSDAGKRVVVVNVPVTYPPRQVNGILVAVSLEDLQRSAADVAIRQGVAAEALAFDAVDYDSHPSFMAACRKKAGGTLNLLLAFALMPEQADMEQDFALARRAIETTYLGAASILSAAAPVFEPLPGEVVEHVLLGLWPLDPRWPHLSTGHLAGLFFAGPISHSESSGQ